MRLYLLSLTSLFFCKSFGQNLSLNDSIPIPKYDTIRVEIRSDNSFPFCGKNYRISRDCKGSNLSNCCSYSADISKGETTPRFGQFTCLNGTSLFWMYCESEENARINLESKASQLEAQNKKFSKEKIICLLADQKVTGYKIIFQTDRGYTGYQISVYGTINGQSVVLDFSSMTEIKCNADIQLDIQKLFKFL